MTTQTLTLAGVRKKYPNSKPDKTIVLSEHGLNALRAYIRCREKADEQKKAMDVYKAIMLSEMKDAESADAGTHTVWAQTVESLRFDVERFSDEHEKLHAEFLTVGKTRRFDIRVKAE